ncbi:MAG: NTP transferase domain-containing protein [Halanaeroarchaeum sp.]
MAGGKGTRLDRGEKPLVPVAGVPMIDHVLSALRDSVVDRVVVATSPATTTTADHVDAATIETPGEGYVADLGVALEHLDGSVLTVVADLPLLTGAVVDRVVDRANGKTTSVCVPAMLVERLGASVDRVVEHDGDLVVPAGINVTGPGDADRAVVLDEPRLAVNVNRPTDLAVAERLLAEGRS